MAKEKIQTVQFKNTESWAGENFSYAPGEIISLPEATALARQEAGMGTIVEQK